MTTTVDLSDPLPRAGRADCRPRPRRGRGGTGHAVEQAGRQALRGTTAPGHPKLSVLVGLEGAHTIDRRDARLQRAPARSAGNTDGRGSWYPDAHKRDTARRPDVTLWCRRATARVDSAGY